MTLTCKYLWGLLKWRITEHFFLTMISFEPPLKLFQWPHIICSVKLNNEFFHFSLRKDLPLALHLYLVLHLVRLNKEGKTKWMVCWVFKDLPVLTAWREAFYGRELEDWTEAYNACTLVISMTVRMTRIWGQIGKGRKSLKF